MAVPVFGRAIFVANNIFSASLWNVSDFYLLSFSQFSSNKNIFRRSALDLVPLAFCCALSRSYSISLVQYIIVILTWPFTL